MKLVFTGKAGRIHFVPFIGTRHPVTDEVLPSPHGLFAVHGGGVADEGALRDWAAQNGVFVSFGFVQ